MFWNTDLATVRNDDDAALDLNGVAFRLYGNVGTGGRLDFHTLDYGLREAWCANGHTTGSIASRIWNLSVDGQSQDIHTVNGVTSLAPPRRQCLRGTWRGLSYELVDVLHHKFPFVISLLKVTNTNGTPKDITAKVTFTGLVNTHKVGGYFYEAGRFARLEDETATSGYSSSSLVTVQSGATKTFVAVYGGTALTVEATGLPLFTEAQMLTWAESLDAGVAESYAATECDRIDTWYRTVYANTVIGSTPLRNYLPDSVLYTEEQVITQASGRQYTLHGGWAEVSRQGGGFGANYWYPYPTSTMHQSYPYHYVLLQANRDDVVADELKNYALHQNLVTGAMAFHMWPDDVAFAYASTYTEMMFILSVHQYVAFSQDHAFLDEVVNTKTMLEHVVLAHQRIYDTKSNGLPTGADWHDGWDGTGTCYNSQGAMAYVMALDAMAELDPLNAASYTTERDTVKAAVVNLMMATDSGHTFWIRRRNDASFGDMYFATWNHAVLDTAFWAVRAGVGSAQLQSGTMDDIWNGANNWAQPFIYHGPEGVGFHCGNFETNAANLGGLCANAWPEKFFEFAIADAKLGNTRCIDTFDLIGTTKLRWPEIVDGPGFDVYGEEGYNNSGEPTYSSVALAYKWLLDGIFGIRVALNGTVTANPTGVPNSWNSPKVALRVGDAYYQVTGSGVVTQIATTYDIADSILAATAIALPDSCILEVQVPNVTALENVIAYITACGITVTVPVVTIETNQEVRYDIADSIIARLIMPVDIEVVLSTGIHVDTVITCIGLATATLENDMHVIAEIGE